MSRRRGLRKSQMASTIDETEALTPQNEKCDMVDVDLNKDTTAHDEIDHQFNTGVSIAIEGGDSPNRALNNKNINKGKNANQRGLVENVRTASKCCNFMGTIMTVISTILGIAVIISGGLLGYQGTVAVVGFNYVLWIFAGINIIGGIYIIFRTFSLNRSIQQLEHVRDEFAKTQDELEKTQDDLEADVRRLKEIADTSERQIGEYKVLHKNLTEINKNLLDSTSELKNTNGELKNTNGRLNETQQKMSEEVSTLNNEINNMKEVILDVNRVNEELRATLRNAAKNNEILAASVSSMDVENDKLKASIGDLNTQNMKLDDELSRLHGVVELVTRERMELFSANEKLRSAISAIVQANDSSIDVGNMIKEILDDMQKQREAITSERQAMEQFSLALTSKIFSDIDLNGDGVIDQAERSTWLSRIKDK